MANRLKRRSLAVATPIHSPSGSQETDRDSPMVIPPDEVDEDAERRGRVRKRQSIGRFNRHVNETPTTEAPVGQTGAPGTPQTQGALATGVGGYSAAQLAEHYANCMKLSAENKINTKNAFHLQLIDYMSEMMRNKKTSEMDNFQAASCALDASAKIYAYRVDSVHSDTLKLAGGVGKTAQEQEEQDKLRMLEKQMMTQPEQRKKEKRRRKDKPTIEKNISAINCSKFDLEFDVDPLFKKTSAQFDSGSGGGQFLTSLYIKDDGCELQLDSAAFVSIGVPSNTESNMTSALVLPEKMSSIIPNTDSLRKVSICPTFSTFTFTGWSLEQEERLMEDGEVQLEKVDNAMSANNLFNHDEHAFDIDAPPILPTDDMGDNVDPDDSFMGGVEMDVNDDNANEEELAAKKEVVDNRNKKGLGLDLMNVDNIRDHLLTAPSEYSYFDTGRFGGWAGPRHWKFKPLQRQAAFRASADGNNQNMNGDEEIAAKRKRIALKNIDEVHDFLKLLEASIKELMSSGSQSLDRLEKNMARPKRAIQLVKKTMENWEEERVVLPKDLHYKGKDFARLFVADYSVSGRSSNSKQTQSVDDTVEDYDFDNENDVSEFCPNAVALSEGHDTEYPLDNAGEEGGFLSQTNAALPSMDGEGNSLGNNDQLNQSLVAAPNKVEKIMIGYAKQAKKMDMRKLKVIEWTTLQQLSEKAESEDKENLDDNGVEKDKSNSAADDPNKIRTDTVVNFTDLYRKLHDPKVRMPPKMLENLSVPLAFVALLHLCNENNLSLENVADFSNFKIQQG